MGRDTIQLEDAVSSISEGYLLEFTSEYGIPKSLHPELPGPEEPIVEFSEGKVGVYTKFFEFANYRIPISQFLFDILGYYQIHLSQLLVIGATKVSHFEINCRVLNIIPTLNLFRIFYVPSYKSGWMSFSKRPGKNTLQCYTKPLDSLKNWNNRFFWVDERIFPTVVEWRTSAPKDKMPSANSYSAADVTILDTHRTPIKKQPELLLCLVGLSQSYFLGDDVYLTFFYDDDRDMDLFNLISAPNPAKVKTETRPHAAHEVPLLTVTTSRVIEMEDTAVASGFSGTPFALEKSPLDFANEDPPHMIIEMGGTADQFWDRLSHEIPPMETATTTEVIQESGLEKELAVMRPPMNKRRRKRVNDKAEANAPPKVLRKDHAAFRPAQSTLRGKFLDSIGLEADFTFFTPATQETPADTKSVSDPEPLSYVKPQPHPEQDVAQSSRKTAPEIPTKNVATAGVQDLLSTESPGSGKSTSVPYVDGSLGSIYQPGWGVTNNCRLDTPNACQDMVDHIVPLGTVEAEVHGLHNRKKNLETLLEAEVSNLQAHVMGEEKIKAAFEEFKKYEDDRVEQRCAEMDARLDKLSVDFDEELYPHMLTAFAGLVKGVRKGLEYGIEHGKVGRDLEAVEAYDPEAHSKYAKALQVLKDLKYPLVDQLEKLKDAPMELIMASLHLENLWAVKEEMLLEDAIAANISRAEKKKKYRVVCGTHGVGSAHHARSDGILVFAPTITPQGLAILLANAATQTKVANKEEEPHPRL
ncbi:hypothetical protein Tco_0657662 [Tanacetum coccineum]